jgi:hypothetical protein
MKQCKYLNIKVKVQIEFNIDYIAIRSSISGLQIVETVNIKNANNVNKVEVFY